MRFVAVVLLLAGSACGGSKSESLDIRGFEVLLPGALRAAAEAANVDVEATVDDALAHIGATL